MREKEGRYITRENWSFGGSQRRKTLIERQRKRSKHLCMFAVLVQGKHWQWGVCFLFQVGHRQVERMHRAVVIRSLLISQERSSHKLEWGRRTIYLEVTCKDVISIISDLCNPCRWFSAERDGTRDTTEGPANSPIFANEWCHDYDNATCHSQRESRGL